MTGVNGNSSRQIPQADNAHALHLDLPVNLRTGHITAAFHGQVHNYRAFLHAANHFCGDDLGCPAAKQLGGGNHHIGCGTHFGHPFALHLELFLGQGLGIAVFCLAGFPQINFDKSSPQGFYLFFHHRAGVEGFNPGAQPFGGGNGLQPRNANPDDENLRR